MRNFKYYFAYLCVVVIAIEALKKTQMFHDLIWGPIPPFSNDSAEEEVTLDTVVVEPSREPNWENFKLESEEEEEEEDSLETVVMETKRETDWENMNSRNLTFDYNKVTHGKASSQSGVSHRPLKHILLYTEFYNQKGWPYQYQGFDGRYGFRHHKCPVDACYLTSNKSHLDSIANYDALIFNLWPSNILVKENNRYIKQLIIPDQTKRTSSQRYIIYWRDPPSEAVPKETMPFSMLSGIFNWTMSYRLDSDIIYPYGIMKQRYTNRTYNEEKNSRSGNEWIQFNMDKFRDSLSSRGEDFWKLAEKPKGVAWVVSHCTTHSQRENYVAELQKYIQVDVFGACGDHCGRAGDNDNCMEAVNTDYKFYLAFENSLCEHYVTEKFWRTMNHNIVPIVRGMVHYQKIAPPHSYINVGDFDGPEAVARYLIHLIENKEEYLSYFWWKSEYLPDSSAGQTWMSMCYLCQKLHDSSEPEKILEVNDLEAELKCTNEPGAISSFKPQSRKG